MKYGSAPDTTIDPVGEPDTPTTRAHTASQIEHVCAQMGADEIEVYQDYDEMRLGVGVSGLSTDERNHLYMALRECTSPGIEIVVRSLETGNKTEHVLTDQELLKVISCLPDGWEPGDDIEMADVDWERLKPIADDVGGFPELVEAVKRSTADGSEVRSDAVKVENMSTLWSGDRSAHETAERRETDTVEQVQQAYVEGEIGILELEERLDDAIELDHDPL